MLMVHTENSEIFVTGKIEVGDIYTNFCCDGYDFEIVLTFPTIDSFWGVCKNPDCWNISDGYTKETDYYQGVADFCEEDFAELLTENKTLNEVYNATN